MDSMIDSRIAVIGGVGFSLDGIVDEVKTPYGNMNACFTGFNGKKAVFLKRHGEGHLPPHKVDYRAIISAAKSCGATNVISVNTVGTMSYHPIGSFFIPQDFVEFTKTRINTFFDGKAVHVDMSEPYCPMLRSCLKDAMLEMNIQPSVGVYVCAEGPHLESPAQIKMMRQFGDVIGMTGYPEVVLAKELGLCYASLCIVTNEACGMNQGRSISLSEITKQMEESSTVAREIISLAAKKISTDGNCSCKKACH
jgi:5'-methylthioadenosine phosphorylase